MSSIPLSDLTITPPGASNSPRARFFPRIKGGVCEYCGVIDQNYPGNEQYKLCPHYKGRDLKCTFCKESADHADVIRMSDMIVHEDPYMPGALVTMCGSYECDRKYKAKYHLPN